MGLERVRVGSLNGRKGKADVAYCCEERRKLSWITGKRAVERA